jgi:hypothetical protein
MPTIDWVHVAMFVLGLAMQWLAHRAAQAAAPTPATPSSQPTPIDPNLLLDLAHKLLDQRQLAAKP